MAQIEQIASAQTPKLGKGDRGSAKVRAAFNRPTAPGRLVVACLLMTGGLDVGTYFSDKSFTLVRRFDGVRDLKLAVWYRENAPSVTSLTAWADAYRGMDLRLFEISGIKQLGALDKFVASAGDSRFPGVGPTSGLAVTGEFVLGIVASQYNSATQGGFGGGLTKLTEAVVPGPGQQDWERGRATYHIGTVAGTDGQRLSAQLSTQRRWITFLMTFRPGTAGPARFTATTNRSVLKVGGRAQLTSFGPLKATVNRRVLGAVPSARARIGPFEGQIRLGGWSGLLIGTSTPYRIQQIDGLSGRQVRTSDDDLPRADGASRGVDLQSARQFIVKVNWDGAGAAPGDGPARIEELREDLYRAVPVQRDTDQEVVFRKPGGPLRSVWCRATEVPRDDENEQVFRPEQPIVFRAADPRHYSAIQNRVTVPVTPDEGETVLVVGATNGGNARAYPTIRVGLPQTGTPVTRIQLVNVTAAVTFDVQMAFPLGSELVGDMSARATAAPVSPVTLDGQSRYGGWQLPRDTFYLAPAPDADAGVNLLYLRTTPVNIPVTCTLDFFDTWSG